MNSEISLQSQRIRMGRLPRRPLLLGLLMILLTALLLATTRGAYAIAPGQMLGMVLGKLGIVAVDADPVPVAVLWNLRLPRVLLGVAVGVALGLSGAALQSLFRNPLADPALVGISSGAALAVALSIVFGGVVWSSPDTYQAVLPVVAFVGALVAALLVYRIGCTAWGVSVAAMLLAGIAVNALALALIGLASYLASDEQLRTLTFWSLGSLSAASWRVTGLVALGVLPATVLLLSLCRGMNALALGEAEARHLGIEVERLKKAVILASALAVGASVAFCGVISFVGLVAPHIVRLLSGPDAKVVLPGGALLGAVLVVSADTAARTLAAPAEVPIGVLTALLGAPFFLFLLLRVRERLVT